MKSYPSIPKTATLGARYHIFDKIDGSNLRFEWDRKRGWFLFGTRTRLFDASDPMFGCAIPLFRDTLADPLERLARVNRWEGLIVFAEFWGAGSFAGQHDPDTPKVLSLIDIAPHKKGILGPEEFLRYVGELPHAAYLGEHTLSDELIQSVRNGSFAGMTDEGIIGKRGDGHKLEMFKAKTQMWIDRVREKFSPEEAERLIAS